MIIGVMASGEGTTLQAVLDACAQGRLSARVGLVMSNNSNASALRRAADAGVFTVHLSSRTHPEPLALDAAMLEHLKREQVDLVLLAGFMKKNSSST
jgi:phosphoribosylglycinamide formyltransferase-1